MGQQVNGHRGHERVLVHRHTVALNKLRSAVNELGVDAVLRMKGGERGLRVAALEHGPAAVLSIHSEGDLILAMTRGISDLLGELAEPTFVNRNLVLAVTEPLDRYIDIHEARTELSTVAYGVTTPSAGRRVACAK